MDYLIEESHARARQAILAVAAPVTVDQVTLTNHVWTFSIEALGWHLGLQRLRVINDFAVNPLAIPQLGESDRFQIGPGAPTSDAPVGLIGPGTGLGIGALIPTANGPLPLPGEGGHDAQESAILEHMRERYDHVSAERLLTPGLVNLYNTLSRPRGGCAATL